MTGTHPPNRRLGYARVRTYRRTLDAQLAQLRAVGCVRFYRERASGAQQTRRELLRMLKALCVPTRSLYALTAKSQQLPGLLMPQGYAARADIEGTHAQVISRCGLRRCRNIGLAKTHLQHVITAAAVNLVQGRGLVHRHPNCQDALLTFFCLAAGCARLQQRRLPRDLVLADLENLLEGECQVLLHLQRRP
jgi:hypothetical protein